MWNTEDCELFAKLYERFIASRPGKTKAERTTIVKFLKEEGHPDLAGRFFELSESVRMRANGAVLAATNGKICVICKACFVKAKVCHLCQQTPEGKALQKKLERESAGKTCVERHGGVGAASTSIRQKMDTTCVKEYGTRVPIAYHSKTKNKARRTMRRLHGGSVPAHCPALVKRMQRSTYGIKTFEYSGRSFEYQGYEAKAIRWLCEEKGYDPNEISTQYEEPHQIFFKRGGVRRKYTPDLYLREVDLNIEVKSPFTLFGTRGRSLLEKNQAIQRACNRRDFPLRFVLVTRSGKAFPLPKDWHELSRDQLSNFILRKAR